MINEEQTARGRGVRCWEAHRFQFRYICEVRNILPENPGRKWQRQDCFNENWRPPGTQSDVNINRGDRTTLRLRGEYIIGTTSTTGRGGTNILL